MAAAAIVVSAVATALLARLARRWLPRRLGPRLALSRLARDPVSATAFLAATVAFGAAGYGLLFHASADDATTDKIATAVGANSVFGVDDPVEAAALAADVGESTSCCARSPGSTTSRATASRRGPGDVRRAANWSPRFSGREVSDLIRQLRGRPDLDAVPVLLAGDDAHVPASGTLARGDNFEVPYRVVDRIAGFAGSGPSQTVLVVDQDALLGLAPPGRDRLARGRAVERPRRRHRRPRGARRRAPVPARGHRRRGAGRALHPRGQVLGDPLPPGVHGAGAAAWACSSSPGCTGKDREQRRLQDRTLADLGHPWQLASRAAGAALSVVALLGAAAGGVAAYAVTASLAERLDPEPSLHRRSR